jgi:hypothetical protein
MEQQHRDERALQRKRTLRRIGRYGGAVVMLVAAIGYTASTMRPIYAHKAPVVGELIKSVTPPADEAGAPPSGPPPAALIDSIQRLVRTGRMTPARADSIAHFAVREAFLRGVPPAVIFGVMLTENAQFISKAQSNVGAVGLMQVYPKVWLKDLSKKFGASDIEADSTNLRYGVFILEHYLKPRGKKAQGQTAVAAAPGSLMKGLLRYNGCVRGTNTPRCHTYPNKVAKFVERDAQALCGEQSFYECIAQPFMKGLFGSS